MFSFPRRVPWKRIFPPLCYNKIMVAIIQKSSPLLVRRGDYQLPSNNDTCKRARKLSQHEKVRTVRFHENHESIEVPGRDGFSPLELSLMHMSKVEHERIQMEIVEVIRDFRISSIQYVWSGKELERLRGLERITNHDDIDRPFRLKRAVSAVINQHTNGGIDETWLSNVYRPLTARAESVAIERARLDRESAFSDAPRIIVMTR